MKQVRPTRMELLKFKRQLKMAQRGHKLLKEKRDGLVKKFMAIIGKARQMRTDLEKSLGQAFFDFFVASADYSQNQIAQLLSNTDYYLDIDMSIDNIMSVQIPCFKVNKKQFSFCFSSLSAPAGLEKNMKDFSQSLDLMIKLAQIEHSARLLSFEIEKTRRRVNALEYVIIPEVKETIKAIQSKLDEQERSDKIIKMKLKELVG